MPKSTNPWYIDFFSDDYLEIYGYTFSAERTNLEVSFIEALLELPPKSTILDLCCGQGRHAVALAKHGFNVTGQDLNADYLRQAEEYAKKENVLLNLINKDMRTIPFYGELDAVINIYSSFGYLESHEENLSVLKAIKVALKPGGLLLMDLINREWVIRNYDQTEWREGQGGIIHLEHRALDLISSRNHINFTIIYPDGTRKVTAGHHIRLYSLTEMIELFNLSGLTIKSFFGSFQRDPYSLDSKRMILLVENQSSVQIPH